MAATGPNYAAFGSEEVQVNVVYTQTNETNGRLYLQSRHDRLHQGLTGGMSGMTMREEPECIKKWKLEQEEMLKKKDADEEVCMGY